MKIKYLLFGILFFVSCDKEEDENLPLPIKYPFEALDETYFKLASSQLGYTNDYLRLDSIVTYHYYRFNPETGVSDYKWRSKSNSVNASPTPEFTNRKTEIYIYDSSDRLERIDFYQEESDSQTEKGKLNSNTHFVYDNNNNLVKRVSEISNSEEYNNSTEYFYKDEEILVGYRTISNTGNAEVGNIQHNGQKLIVNVTYGSYTSTIELTIDSFKNLVKTVRMSANSEYVEEYKYPTNIYSPYYQLFPYNFISHLYWGGLNGAGSMHFTTGPTENFYNKIQLNKFYYPEIIQSGSYDDGYRIKYYYSKR